MFISITALLFSIYTQPSLASTGLTLEDDLSSQIQSELDILKDRPASLGSYKQSNSSIFRYRFPKQLKQNKVLQKKSKSFSSSNDPEYSPLSEILPNDRAESLVDLFQFSNPKNMDLSGLRKGKIQTAPWSGSYWPTSLVGVARRYADYRFPNSSNWSDNVAFLKRHQGEAYADRLSPAEKYDMLVGDSKYTLTNYEIQNVESEYAHLGVVEPWSGLCHGWAPASYMMSRPEKDVNVLAADGFTLIKFKPADLRALATLLWANGEANYRFIGGRCNQKVVGTDPYGRPTSSECLDTNPGTWHMALVNQIGLKQRSLIFDAAARAEVWNQPVTSYEYVYFNPKTMRSVRTIDEATVLASDFPNDKYRVLRSSQTKWIIGIGMNVNFLTEVEPNLKPDQGVGSDKFNSKNWSYDLEVDSNGSIVGGEWYQSEHPDFLWTPVIGSSVYTRGDEYLERIGLSPGWDGTRSLPGSWQAAAAYGSSIGQPLRRIVEVLIALSAQ